MTRTPFVAGNWKMHKTHLEAIQAVQKLSYLLDQDDAERVEVVVCPPFTALRTIQTLIDSDRLRYGLGAQNVHWEDEGAYTGEISPPMLVALRRVAPGVWMLDQMAGRENEAPPAGARAALLRGLSAAGTRVVSTDPASALSRLDTDARRGRGARDGDPDDAEEDGLDDGLEQDAA